MGTQTTYRRADLERVPPSALRPGDLIASAGPPGSGLFTAHRVTFAGFAGYDAFWKANTYRVEYATDTRPGYFTNPDTMPVYRVRRKATP